MWGCGRDEVIRERLLKSRIIQRMTRVRVEIRTVKLVGLSLYLSGEQIQGFAGGELGMFLGVAA